MKTRTAQGFAKTMTISEAAKRDSITTIVTPFDDDRDEKHYKWTEVQSILELGSNVARARWMPEKLQPIFENTDAPALVAPSGRCTKFCAQMLFRYKVFVTEQQKDYSVFVTLCNDLYPKNDETVVFPTIEDDCNFITRRDEDVTKANGANGSALSLFKADNREGKEDLEARFFALQSLQKEVESLEMDLSEAEDEEWENQIIEQEIQRQEQELKRRKREAALRLKVRRSLGKEDS